MSKLNYQDSLSLSMSLADFERGSKNPNHSTFHLERMKLLLSLLGNPQDNVPSIHVAGTKGKGSTCALLTSILDSSGYVTGLCTSPHLHSVTERIRGGLEHISKESFACLVQELWPYVLEVGREGSYGEMTWFEFMIGASFYFFNKNKVDIQVVETGLGGRLDATNILMPILSVITSISLDHTAILGDTIEEITFEKGGIIKPQVPVIVSPQPYPEKVSKVLDQISENKDSKLTNVADQYSYDVLSVDIDCQSILVNGILDEYRLDFPLYGKHQIENLLTSICVSEQLIENGFKITKSSLEEGVANVKWSGRMEVIEDDNKLVIVDGAHNPYSVRRLTESISELLAERKCQGNIWVLFGALKNHDSKKILEELLPLNPVLLPVSSRHPKSSSREEICDSAHQVGLRLDTASLNQANTVSQVLNYVESIAGDSDLILATGSLSVVAEVIESKKMLEPELYPDII